MTHVVCHPCDGCKPKNCITGCPENCFFEDDHMVVINPEMCTDCGICVKLCERQAIFHEDGVPDEWLWYIDYNHHTAIGSSVFRLFRQETEHPNASVSE